MPGFAQTGSGRTHRKKRLDVIAGAGVREPALRLVSHERLRAAAGLPPRVLSLRVHVRHHPAVVAAAADLGQPLTGVLARGGAVFYRERRSFAKTGSGQM